MYPKGVHRGHGLAGDLDGRDIKSEGDMVDTSKVGPPKLLSDDEVRGVVEQWLVSAGERGAGHIPSLVETIAKLRGWLRLYGRHVKHCTAWSEGSWRDDDKGICNCGLAEILG